MSKNTEPKKTEFQTAKNTPLSFRRSHLSTETGDFNHEIHEIHEKNPVFYTEAYGSIYTPEAGRAKLFPPFPFVYFEYFVDLIPFFPPEACRRFVGFGKLSR